VRQIELPGDFHLLVGRDVQSGVQMRNLLGDALLWAGMIALGLGTLGAWAVRRIFAVTLANISETAAAVAAGDFERRVRRSGNGDEFDKIADTINEMLDTIGRLMDGVRQVSNAIAHDLRTPIARARTRLEEAATHARSEADLRAALERAIADLDGLTAIFEALLRIAEIEAGNRRAAFGDVDLAPLLLDMADLYGAVAEERGIALRTEVPESVPVSGDRDMLQQALANLIDNALKFAPAGSVVQVGAGIAGETVAVWVADQGPGIPEADRGHATDRFFRGESARSTPGSGLGLALVQAVTTLHGGRLELGDNAPGLRATITLRRRPVPAVALTPQAAS
jgi:signal transduction histidine kinase